MDWRSRAKAPGGYRSVAVALIEGAVDLDIPSLGQDPWATIDEMDELDIRVEAELHGSCKGGGYYDRASKTIYLHPTGNRRDNFTLLHELGHYLQQRHAEWGLALLDLDRLEMRKTEEAVSDAIAAEILLQQHVRDVDLSGINSPAKVAADIYARSEASRSAAMRYVHGVLGDGTKWILSVADLDGRVLFSQSTYEAYPSKKGMVQPGFAALAVEAEAGVVRRNLHEGMVYQHGQELQEMRAEAALDLTGTHVFVALTPAERFGRGKVVRSSFTCDDVGCETEEFTADPSTRWCASCCQPHCPTCDRCACERGEPATICPSCFMQVTAYEQVNDLHECW